MFASVMESMIIAAQVRAHQRGTCQLPFFFTTLTLDSALLSFLLETIAPSKLKTDILFASLETILTPSIVVRKRLLHSKQIKLYGLWCVINSRWRLFALLAKVIKLKSSLVRHVKLLCI